MNKNHLIEGNPERIQKVTKVMNTWHSPEQEIRIVKQDDTLLIIKIKHPDEIIKEDGYLYIKAINKDVFEKWVVGINNSADSEQKVVYSSEIKTIELKPL